MNRPRDKKDRRKYDWKEGRKKREKRKKKTITRRKRIRLTGKRKNQQLVTNWILASCQPRMVTVWRNTG